MSLCHRIQHIQHIHMIEWHYQIPENACLVRTSNIRHPVHMKNDVFRHHVVFQKPQYLQEGKNHYMKMVFMWKMITFYNVTLNFVECRCDVPRTPHRRTQELPACSGGSRTAPRPMNSLNSSIVGIGKVSSNFCHIQAILLLLMNISFGIRSRKHTKRPTTTTKHKPCITVRMFVFELSVQFIECFFFPSSSSLSSFLFK